MLGRGSENVTRLVESLDFNWIDFDIEAFARFVAHQRNRTVYLVSYPFDDAITAAWVRGQRGDFIFYRENAPHLLQTHSILHELGHLLLNHRGVTLDDAEIAQMLYALASHKASVIDSSEEQDAEHFARLVILRVRQAKRHHHEGHGTSIAALQPLAESGF